MGPDRAKNIRNILIIVGLALVVWLVPGGGTGSSTIYNLLTILLTAGLLFFGYRLYMEHRATIFGLGDQQRGVLYGSVTLASAGAAGDVAAVERGRAGRADLDGPDRARGVGHVPRVEDVLGVLSSSRLARVLRHTRV